MEIPFGNTVWISKELSWNSWEKRSMSWGALWNLNVGAILFRPRILGMKKELVTRRLIYLRMMRRILMKWENFALGARNRLRLFFIGQIEPSPTCYNKNTIQTLIKIAIRHRRWKILFNIIIFPIFSCHPLEIFLLFFLKKKFLAVLATFLV